MLFLLNEGLGVEIQLLAQSAKEFGGAVQPNWRLKVRFFQPLAEFATILAIQADIRVGIREGHDIVQRTAQREDQIDLGANSLH